MAQPKTIQQYREYFQNQGISSSEVKSQWGDLRRLPTWVKAYNHHTRARTSDIQGFNEAIAQKEVQEDSNPIPVVDVEVVEVVEVVETEKSSSTLEETFKPVPTLRPLSRLDNVNDATPKSLYGLDILEVDLGVFATPQQPPPGGTIPLHKRGLPPDMGKLTLVQWRGLPLKISLKLPNRFKRQRSPPKLKDATP
ncbi:MAG: hypothetical protein AAGJ08_01785 [Cyanobacteria bacterium P01_H01_bin.35]